MSRTDLLIVVVIFVMLVAFGGHFANRVSECEKAGGTLIRTATDHECVKVEKLEQKP